MPSIHDRAKRLPRIDLPYWVMILSANTIGESGGDLISMTLGLGYAASTATLIGLFLFAAIVDVMVPRRALALYWIAIILSSTAGTTLSDLLTRNWLGSPEHPSYGLAAAAIVVALATAFAAWRLVQPRQDLDAPFGRPAELLYWLAILISSTLGTAFGDFIANGTPLGFGGGTLVLIVALVLVGGVTKFTPAPRALCYWLAIVVAHPLGATMGDYMTKDEGMGLGNLRATIVLTVIFLAISAIAFWVPRRRDATRDRDRRACDEAIDS